MGTTVEAPEGVRVGNEKLIKLTDAAGKKVCQLRDKEDGKAFLRIKITGGGCNGLSYKMKFISDPKRGDILVHTAGADVIIDGKSALYLKGCEIDYSDALVAGGFKFINPNASSSCSCGESFAV